MRTAKQIANKITKLKVGLVKRAKNKGIYENFGQAEVFELKDYIGDVYEYPYLERKVIQNIINSFDEWCMNYSDLQVKLKKRG